MHLEAKKKLIGIKIDSNWRKYKLHRNKRYLVKLNKFVDQLVIIDKILTERRKAPLRNWVLYNEHKKASQTSRSKEKTIVKNDKES